MTSGSLHNRKQNKGSPPSDAEIRARCELLCLSRALNGVPGPSFRPSGRPPGGVPRRAPFDVGTKVSSFPGKESYVTSRISS